ncbi:TPA: YagK/YfjJ domain-containing protein [Serratia fonticola]
MFTDSYFDIESTSMHVVDSDTTLVVTNDFDTVQQQRGLLSILNKIVTSEAAAFRVTRTGGYEKIKTGVLIEQAVSGLPELENSIGEHQQLHPTILLFSDTIKTHNLDESSMPWGTSLREVAAINHWLELFRKEAQSVTHKRRLRNFQRAASKNLAGTLAYVDNLFENHSRLLVIRVDLSYQEVIVKSKKIPADLTRLHRKRLFKRVQSHHLFKHCLGYIWKLEYGQKKGFHYHTCFFFDGSKVRKDVTLARSIGEYWKRDITDGIGIYFNCNAIASTYAQLGIGDIHYTNKEKRSALQKAITYITKADTLVRLTMPGNARTFGRGECLVQTKAKRGRRRQHPTQLLQHNHPHLHP